MTLPFREYTYLGNTQSLCPECLQVVPAKILDRRGRVYFRKRCPEHGVREDFVCSDSRWFDKPGYHTPARQPLQMAVEPSRGCPYDCGLCTEHEQHTCIGLLEITSACNLECPICFASSGPGGHHLTVEQCRAAIDHLVAAEGQAEILQLSGGEPTIHPQFFDICDYACSQPIDYVMVNTNGLRLARDRAFAERLAAQRHKVEIYLQFDGLEDSNYDALRDASLLEVKQQAVEVCGEVGLNVILVATLQAGVNADQIGPIVRYGMQRPSVTGVSFQPACYTGRHFLPADLEDRITFPDVLHSLEEQCGDVWRASDFTPLPCAHPNGHTLAYGYRSGSEVTPLARFVDIEQNLDLLSGGITFTRPRARQLIEQVMSRLTCGEGCGCGAVELGGVGGAEAGLVQIGQVGGQRGATPTPSPDLSPRGGEGVGVAAEFFERAMTERLTPANMFRITTTSFMDAYNFDVRQLMKSCVHFVLPTGHLIPFSAYNVLYREGHVPLPKLKPQEATV
ncbi:Antilisterial bacteriocin subtilosin biosynthesis protein AlbA [Posidoniimonas polymericola]|uniref:Antilisterial bacteriocin subtilosin biosynthesis protein AlbA n=1 Tax=Posidoniimonas polymericola TaxID=2528002 RepID=A0A5C5YRJ5_9BACT|nr:radical SAM protein [Posidoniimonas polymericola]TWT77552.1 Antilisterial bacteriocin subtilosin biosynthesis protein AlbA [Posidoniimonas polymericola]